VLANLWVQGKHPFGLQAAKPCEEQQPPLMVTSWPQGGAGKIRVCRGTGGGSSPPATESRDKKGNMSQPERGDSLMKHKDISQEEA